MFKITYEEYIEYGGTVEEAAYPVMQRRAGIMLDRLTFGHITDQDGTYGQIIDGIFVAFDSYELEALGFAIVALIATLDLMDQQRAQALSGAGSEANIKSRTSGGESVSYETRNTIYDEALKNPNDLTIYKNAVLDVCDPFVFQYNPFYAGLESRWN